MNPDHQMYTHKIKDDDFETHLIDKNTITKEIQLTNETLLESYSTMVKIRTLEEQAFKNYNHMRGFLHLSIGQESIYTAIKNILADKIKLYDFIGSYRCHALAYITGSSVQSICYELLGRSKGMSKGKGGSMHLYNQNFFGGHGIVGAQVSLGTGLAFAMKYKNKVMDEKRKAVFCFFGDGASNQGQVYECYNMALIYKLPIIYIIENNNYGMWTSVKDINISDNFYKRWTEMRGIRIKNNTLIAIQCILKLAIFMVSDGPIIIQIDTYRHCGHAMNDQEAYRTEEEKAAAKRRDCIDEIKGKLCDIGFEKECETIRKKILKDTIEYFEKAKNCPLPDESELYMDITL